MVVSILSKPQTYNSLKSPVWKVVSSRKFPPRWPFALFDHAFGHSTGSIILIWCGVVSSVFVGAKPEILLIGWESVCNVFRVSCFKLMDSRLLRDSSKKSNLQPRPYFYVFLAYYFQAGKTVMYCMSRPLELHFCSNSKTASLPALPKLLQTFRFPWTTYSHTLTRVPSVRSLDYSFTRHARNGLW